MISPSTAFIANILNMVLATGIFTLPFSLWETGLILGGLILLIVSLISFTTNMLLIETIAIANAIESEEKLILESTLEIESSICLYKKQEVELIIDLSSKAKKTKQGKNVNFNKINDQTLISSQSPSENEENEEEKDNFFIFKRIEVCKLATKLNGFLYLFVVIVLILYLYISITSNALLLGNSIDRLIRHEFNIYDTNTETLSLIYYISIAVYFILIVIISQKNIEDLKKFTSIVMSARLLVILLFFSLMIYTIITYGPSDISSFPTSNFSNSALMIGNTLFFFMTQHSIPGMIEGFTPQKNLIRLLLISFFSSFSLFFIYGFVSFLAFGQYKSCDLNVFPAAINSYFNLNFMKIPVFGDILNYYPVFNILTGSIQMITLRNNVLIIINGFSPSFVTMYESWKTSNLLKNHIKTVGFSVIYIVPSIIISTFLTNIQQMMKYVTSFLGFFLMIIIPVVLNIKYRQLLVRSKIGWGTLNRSFIKNNLGLYGILLVSVGVLGVIVVNIIFGSDKKCVAE